MLEISNKTNLLEQNIYKYSLQDVEEPNLYREMFDYEEVPKIAFNHRRVPMNMPTDIWITDTSFRDGMQSMAPYTVKQRVDLFKYLARLGGPYGIIRQSVFHIYETRPGSNRKMYGTGLQVPGDYNMDSRKERRLQESKGA